MAGKILLFDLIASQPIEGHMYHGGGKYAKKLFLAIITHISRHPDGWTLNALYDSSLYLDGEISQVVMANSITMIDAKDKTLTGIISEFSITRLYTALPFNLSKYGYFDLIASSLCDNVITIHGLRTLELPVPLNAIRYIESNTEKIRFLLKKVLDDKMTARDYSRYAELVSKTKVIAVSNHTKYSIMAFYPSVGPIPVFYSPDVTEFQDDSEDLSGFDESNYFLLVNGNRWLKNNMHSAKVLDQLLSERKDITQNVIITGVSNPQVYLQSLKNKHRFKFYKYVSDGLLALLYKNAYAFVYLSLNEGFGYPPLEAMKWGTPVLTSPLTSIPEVCGDAVLYSNPFSVSETKSRMIQLLDNDNHASLQIKGRERYNQIRVKQEADLVASVEYLLS